MEGVQCLVLYHYLFCAVYEAYVPPPYVLCFLPFHVPAVPTAISGSRRLTCLFRTAHGYCAAKQSSIRRMYYLHLTLYTMAITISLSLLIPAAGLDSLTECFGSLL